MNLYSNVNIMNRSALEKTRASCAKFLTCWSVGVTVRKTPQQHRTNFSAQVHMASSGCSEKNLCDAR